MQALKFLQANERRRTDSGGGEGKTQENPNGESSRMPPFLGGIQEKKSHFSYYVNKRQQSIAEVI